MAHHIVDREYAANAILAIERLLERYRELFGTAPSGIFVLGTVAPLLLTLLEAEAEGSQSRMKRCSAQNVEVFLPATEEDAKYLDNASNIIYSDSANEEYAAECKLLQGMSLYKISTAGCL